MISSHTVSKHFGLFPAIHDISFDIAKGEIVGFLGPNGAGKTTLMRMLTGYLTPTKGSIHIDNNDVAKNSLKVRNLIGYLPETPPLYPDMTVYDYLVFAAQLRDIPTRQIKSTVNKILDKCHIADVLGKTIATLSKGYKQRVGIAQAIIHDPQVLILDEPTSGLDPLQIIQVRNLIKDCEQKRTVILSTHILSEIEQIAKRVIIIKSGQIVADNNIDSLLKDENGTRASLEEVFLKLTTRTEITPNP